MEAAGEAGRRRVIQLAIVPATAADLDAIEELEAHAFRTPWPRSVFEGELTREHARLDVARDGSGQIVAFCNWWCVVPAAELHVHAITTHPDLRRRGIGAQLVAHMLATGQAAGCPTTTLEVRRGNAPAIALYTRAGFRTVHVRAGYYQDNGEDALVMIRS
jgi:ribosomal-protein-alanine N-acetyltransferase